MTNQEGSFSVLTIQSIPEKGRFTMKLIILFVTALALTSCNWKSEKGGDSDGGKNESSYTISNDYKGQALYIRSGDQEITLTNSDDKDKEEVRCVQLKKEHFNNLRVQYASASLFWSTITFDWLDGGAEILCSSAEGDEDSSNCPDAGSFKYIKGSSKLVASEAVTGCKVLGEDKKE